MTIDERLEKLTQRHEALAQHLELMQHESEERRREWEKRFSSLSGFVNEIAVSTARLLSSMTELRAVVESHERRLHRLEDESA